MSMKQSNLNNVFGRIVSAAEHPHLSIPETETRKNRKKYRQLFNRSLTFVSGMFALSLPPSFKVEVTLPSSSHTSLCAFNIYLSSNYSWGCCCCSWTRSLPCLCSKEKLFQLGRKTWPSINCCCSPRQQIYKING